MEHNPGCSTRGNKYILNHTFHYDLRKKTIFLHASLIFGIAYQTMLSMLILHSFILPQNVIAKKTE